MHYGIINALAVLSMQSYLGFIFVFLYSLPAFAWYSNDHQDTLTGQAVMEVYVKSANRIEVNGETIKARLHVRNHPRHGKAVFLHVEAGYILCFVDGCQVSAALDGKVSSFKATGHGPAFDTITFHPVEQAIAKLRSKKKARFEINLRKQPSAVFEFDITDFSDAMLRAPPKQKNPK